MPKVSDPTFVEVGLVGPKLNPDVMSGVGDGQQADIPALIKNCYQLRQDASGSIKRGVEVAALVGRGRHGW